MPAPLADDLIACLRYYSRLPLPAPQEAEPPDFRTAVRALPLAGAFLGVCAAAVLLAARALGLPPILAATVAVATLALVTGALHETGLAELADRLGGASREEALGVPGAIALIFSLLLRAEALAGIAERSVFEAAAAVVFSAALSRTAGLLPIMLLAAARGEGDAVLRDAALRPFEAALRSAALLVAAVAVVPLVFGAPFGRVLLAGAGAVGAAYAIARLAGRRSGGLGGDVMGAAQQSAEAAALLALAGR